MIITKIHRKNAKNSKKLIIGITAFVFAFLMLTAVFVGVSVEKKAEQVPAAASDNTVVAEVSDQQVISLSLN